MCNSAHVNLVVVLSIERLGNCTKYLEHGFHRVFEPANHKNYYLWHNLKTSVIRHYVTDIKKTTSCSIGG